MADTYWLSFRLNDSGQWADTYDHRYDALIDVIKTSCNGKWWFETSSFFLFASTRTADQLVSSIKMAIAESVDLVVLGKTDYKTGRVIGNCKDKDIYELVPFMKKA